MKTALLDASSAIILAKGDLHLKLIDTYNIVMAQSVYDEVTVGKMAGSEEWRMLFNENRISLAKPQENTNIDGLHKMDLGEIDTIKLYLEGQGEFLITDDGKAARFCKNADIPFINALLFPVVLYFRGEFDRDNRGEYFSRIISLGRYSQQVIEYAEKCSVEEIRFCLKAE